ncbi:hypothetical protein NDU88_006818 [Pleurodeles waltl]|uniref:Uncharacterized protein n=1 Tax=Pleurodeles waltl TaxID=8319 RepID=A0AAV7QIU5_PLEWA|nr:hypothetical protein NDU88_006818 [Pleurodeles waltl]
MRVVPAQEWIGVGRPPGLFRAERQRGERGPGSRTGPAGEERDIISGPPGARTAGGHTGRAPGEEEDQPRLEALDEPLWECGGRLHGPLVQCPHLGIKVYLAEVLHERS